MIVDRNSYLGPSINAEQGKQGRQGSGESPGIRALGIGTLQDVSPQSLGDGAGLAILALALLRGALGTVPQEKQPALLLGNVLPVVGRHLQLKILLTALIITPCMLSKSAEEG